MDVVGQRTEPVGREHPADGQQHAGVQPGDGPQHHGEGVDGRRHVAQHRAEGDVHEAAAVVAPPRRQRAGRARASRVRAVVGNGDGSSIAGKNSQ